MEVPLSLITETVEALERAGCQFWACEGPTLEPVSMLTCNVCAVLAQWQAVLDQAKASHDPEAFTIEGDIDQFLTGQRGYELVHPGTGYLIRISLGRTEGHRQAVVTTEFAADIEGAQVASHGYVTYSDLHHGQRLAQGFARMYAGRGYVLQTQSAQMRRATRDR
jgi:hypothetical protein